MKPSALVVDDDAAIRSLVMTLLQREGYEVSGAQDGIDALDALRARDFDVVVLDLMMPRLDGRGVIETLARERDGGSMPRIVVMTAASPNVVEQLPRDHVAHVITKPFDIRALREVVAAQRPSS